MSTRGGQGSPPARSATLRNIERSVGSLSTLANQHMEERLPWYSGLSAQERSWVGAVAQAGIAAFIAWYADPVSRGRLTTHVFSTAPRELTRVITLGQTLDLIRAVVDVVEEHVGDLAAPGEEAELNLAVLRYTRDIAFAAAHVYAGAAEARGAWDARLESLVVDAVLRGEADDELASRAAALGWGDVNSVTVVAAGAPRGERSTPLDELRHEARRLNVECLLAVQGRRLVLILGGGGTLEPMALVAKLTPWLGPGPIVVGPLVPHLFAAGRSARAALSGYRAAAGWPDAPRPCLADDLLPERVLLGDDAPARRALIDRIYAPLALHDGPLLTTATEYLAHGRSLEATARANFIHPNTVRYRLGRVADLTGYDVTHARDAFVVGVALALGRLDGAGRGRTWRVRPEPRRPSEQPPATAPDGDASEAAPPTPPAHLA